ncbi:molecular chaperone [Ferrimonas lipolytica]|uniref:Molecular chaperone n=1 Tax=Ferrimonas lipolytica TaxID=2724191 RepID=A0A6H1U8U6_9GAMM|nr:molecular chaperone [Ferrimonas lipolytica]QIZ75465.1 molecular chaperone [Ferrimonas lipolytica]
MRRLSLVMLFLPVCAWANFTISPMNQTISPKTKTISYTLENKAASRTAFEISTYHRLLDDEGREFTEPAKELRPFPARVILEPGQTKRIKLMYLGKRSLNSEVAYRVNFLQSDKDVDASELSGVKAKYQFVTALYVSPEKAMPSLNVTARQDEQLHLTLSNSGTKHKILQNWGLSLTDSSGQQHQYSHRLPDVNVLAGSHFTLTLPASSLDSGSLQAELTQQQ